MIRPIAKLAILLIFTSCLTNEVLAKSQQWECAVNLQQGDTGTMSLSKVGDKVKGLITTIRNKNKFSSDLNGSWSDNVINLKRLLDANSNEPMAGIVVTLGTEKVKIGGRFSTEYQGVWSADCDLVSSSSVRVTGKTNDSADNAANSTKSSVAPSITSRVSPSKPNSRDRIKLSARASHPDGIETLAFFIGDKKVHTCNGAACDFDYGRLKKGKYSWYAQATSKSGVSNDKRVNQLIVSSASGSACNFKGFATGPSASLSISYRVILVGKGERSGYRNSAEFADLQYTIKGVPKGEYTITVDALADPSVLWSPKTASIKCGSKTDVRQDFDFS